jgi:RNA polymerase sigma-70 factor (ECF subfamily)
MPASRHVADSGADKLLVAARSGDERAFVELTSLYRPALHAHCYRLLGSVHDADDAIQETMLRAWKGIARYEPRAPISAWLYRIATNVCLRMLERRGGGGAPDRHLEPYPEHLVDAIAGPDSLAETRETIGLAFIAAMQLLPPKQRAVLVLRDVLEWSAREVADFLGDSVAAVNSALQRARYRLAREREAGALVRMHAQVDQAAERDLMRRFQDAWDSVDIEGLVNLLADDALMTMPPESMRVAGGGQIARFFATVPLDGRLDRMRLVHTRANGQPAFAAYSRDDEPGTHSAYGLMVFALQGDRVAGITGFPFRAELFARLELPFVIPG